MTQTRFLFQDYDVCPHLEGENIAIRIIFPARDNQGGRRTIRVQLPPHSIDVTIGKACRHRKVT